MRRLFIAAFAVLFLSMVGRLYANSFNPGNYPWNYNSGATLVQSGVISSSTASYAACEFYNNTAAAAFFSVYNSATVGAQTAGSIIGSCEATATNFCYVLAGGPSGPAMNAAIIGGSGLSWFGSSTFPTQTGIGANGWAFCTVNTY